MHTEHLERSDRKTRRAGEALRATVRLRVNGLTPVHARSAPPAESDVPEVGTELGRYRLLAWQGVGSAGVVFRALHTVLDIPVAVKLLYRARFADRFLAHEHLRTEAFLLARLNHPGIVRLWDFEDDPARPYLVTEFVPGESLGDAIRRRGRLEPREVGRVLLQAVEALAALWRFGAVHRDVKPDNLMLASDGSVKVIDLGLAKYGGAGESPTPMPGIASEWAGTPAYLAPEQARANAPVDHRADIYALGVTAYEAATGRLPFLGKSPAQVILRHREEQPIPPADLQPDVPRALSDLILRMMAKTPSARFNSADELRQVLRADVLAADTRTLR